MKKGKGYAEITGLFCFIKSFEFNQLQQIIKSI